MHRVFMIKVHVFAVCWSRTNIQYNYIFLLDFWFRQLFWLSRYYYWLLISSFCQSTNLVNDCCFEHLI